MEDYITNNKGLIMVRFGGFGGIAGYSCMIQSLAKYVDTKDCWLIKVV